jgi:hypothetical protein
MTNNRGRCAPSFLSNKEMLKAAIDAKELNITYKEL